MERSLSLSLKFSNLSLVLFGRSESSLVINSLVLLAIVLASLYLVKTIFNYLDKTKQDLVFLQLTPPSTRDSNSSFEDLFKLIHGIDSSRSIKDRLLKSKSSFSFEVVSSFDSGISFVIGTNQELVPLLKQSIKASLPQVVIKKTSDPVKIKSQSRVYRFKLNKPYYFSLKTSDVPGYLSSLGNLEENEMMAFQLVLSPVGSRMNNKARRALSPKNRSRGWLIKLIMLPVKIIKFSLNRGPKKSGSVVSKFDLPLFSTSIRLIIDSPSSGYRLKAFKAGLATYSSPGVQELKSKSPLLSKVNTWQFERRLPDFTYTQRNILSSAELASLYVFPEVDSGIEDVKQNLSRALPMPLEIKRSKEFDVVIGESNLGDKQYNIGLSEDERQRHMYIIGGTGNGKTTMLEYMVSQDMNSNKGLAVIDPHGDMAENIINYVPENRIQDVIYFNPEDIDYPIGLNLLEMPKTITETEYIKQKDLVVEAVISVLRKIYEGDDNNSAFRIERLLRNAIYSAMTVQGATLFTVLRLLSDKYYRWEVIKDLKDESLKRFWQEEYNKAGDFQRVKLSQGPITRLERFERSAAAMRILSQPKSTIKFDEILSSGKILICNLSKGGLGEDTSALFGAIVIAKIQLAAWRRASISPNKRKPFYLYIDEFQNFASKSYISLFSEARKYGLSITMVQQSIAQLDDMNIVNSLIDNIGTLVAFRSKSPATERLLHDHLEPYISKNELANLSRHNFYAKIAATETHAPVSGKTVLLDKPAPSKRTARKVIVSSRKLYANDYKGLNSLPLLLD